MRSRVQSLALLPLLISVLSSPLHAAACSGEDFAKAVDEAGVQLRAFNVANAPKLQAKLRELKEKKGWSDSDYEARALDSLQDERIAKLDETANELLSKIDTIGQPQQGATDCAKLDELKTAGVELLAVMKTKSAYMLDKADEALGLKPAPKAVSAPPQPAPPPEQKTVKKESPTKPAGQAEKRLPPDDAWRTTTAPKPPEPQSLTEARPPPSDAYSPQPLPPAAFETADGYTIDEIRDATRGFFGTVSTNLATVLEYAFSTFGRPTGYVLGQEGGGAFLAGLRYGSGTLYMRALPETRKVFWHGPSLGYDFGAEGSRTMFLIYRMADPQNLYRSYTGIDGSAYLVGGVGLTLLKGGPVLMAPIRSGVGLRLGANIGYVRFTPNATWNPF